MELQAFVFPKESASSDKKSRQKTHKSGVTNARSIRQLYPLIFTIRLQISREDLNGGKLPRGAANFVRLIF